MDRYILTNLGKQRPWREGVLGAPQLQIRFDGTTAMDLVNHCTVQDLRLTSYDDVSTTNRFAKELTNLVFGASDDWMLWRTLISHDALELYYIDLKRRKQNYRKCSVLLCRILWFDGLVVKLSADTRYGEWEDIASTYTAEFRETDDKTAKKHRSCLTVKYRILQDLHKDIYAVSRPL